MTAALAPGDAIGNYVLTLRRLWQNWGAHVRLYADHIAPSLHPLAAPADQYRPTGQDLLWYHYSIATPNLTQAMASPDFKLMDYHGISPPELYHGRNAQMEALCREGWPCCPNFARHSINSSFTQNICGPTCSLMASQRIDLR